MEADRERERCRQKQRGEKGVDRQGGRQRVRQTEKRPTLRRKRQTEKEDAGQS